MHPATGFILERVVPKGGVTLHDVYLKEGTIVGVNGWVIHRNKSIFGEDVHTFRPERWIEGDEERIKDMKRNQFSVSLCLSYKRKGTPPPTLQETQHLPLLSSYGTRADSSSKKKKFGYGPRSCIGKNISILEMWKAIFELYRNFDIDVVGDKEWEINGSWFTPQRNVEVLFKPRS